MSYWDTSALLKLYRFEPDSDYFLNLLAAEQDPSLSSSIAETEVLCALCQTELAGGLKPGGAHAIFREFVEDCDAGRILTVPSLAALTELKPLP